MEKGKARGLRLDCEGNMGKFSVTSEGQRLVWSREESRLDPTGSLESMEDLNFGVSSQIDLGVHFGKGGKQGAALGAEKAWTVVS